MFRMNGAPLEFKKDTIWFIRSEMSGLKIPAEGDEQSTDVPHNTSELKGIVARTFPVKPASPIASWIFCSAGSVKF